MEPNHAADISNDKMYFLYENGLDLDTFSFL